MATLSSDSTQAPDSTKAPNSLKFGMARAALIAAVLALPACTMNMGTNGGMEGIGFREARHAEITAMRDWRSCRDDALQLDTQARQKGSVARYLASARLLDKCETELGPEAKSLAPEERMRAYALSIQNHLKGGDIGVARQHLETFKTAFAGQDLYLKDGSSFIETMEILLGLKTRSAVGEVSVANVSGDVKSEMRRNHYWQRH